jgi:hypothetical protein
LRQISTQDVIPSSTLVTNIQDPKTTPHLTTYYNAYASPHNTQNSH